MYLDDDVENEICNWIKQINKRDFLTSKDALRYTV